MKKQAVAMRRVSIAAIAAAALSLPLMSAAQADPGTNGAPITKDHVTKDHMRKNEERIDHKEFYDSTRTSSPRDRSGPTSDKLHRDIRE